MPHAEIPPLPAHWFHILLALADRDQHGLAITKEVFDRTEGRLHLWPGMLYGALKKMTDAGYVIEHGRIVYDGSVQRLLAHEDIREFYLGVGHRTDRRRYTEVKQYRRRRRWF